MRWVATAVVVLPVLWWAWQPSGPSYYASVVGGTEVYPCRGGAEPLPVTFSRDGAFADVRFRGRVHRLPYVGKGILEDVYEARGWKLTLDPEANWYGPDGLHLFCVW